MIFGQVIQFFTRMIGGIIGAEVSAKQAVKNYYEQTANENKYSKYVLSENYNAAHTGYNNTAAVITASIVLLIFIVIIVLILKYSIKN